MNFYKSLELMTKGFCGGKNNCYICTAKSIRYSTWASFFEFNLLVAKVLLYIK